MLLKTREKERSKDSQSDIQTHRKRETDKETLNRKNKATKRKIPYEQKFR